MTALSHAIRIALPVLVLCLSAAAPLQAVTAAAPPPPPTSAQTNEDPGPWRRDPFLSITPKNNRKTSPIPRGTLRPAAKPTGPEQSHDIQLQGIIQSDRSYLALINGRAVKAGDTIGGVTIKEISRFRVVTINSQKKAVTYDIYQGRINRGTQ